MSILAKNGGIVTKGAGVFDTAAGKDCCCGGGGPGEPPEDCDDCAGCASSYSVEWTGIEYTFTAFCPSPPATHSFTLRYSVEAVCVRYGGDGSCEYKSADSPSFDAVLRTEIVDYTNCPAGWASCTEGAIIESPCQVFLGCVDPATNRWAVTVQIVGIGALDPCAYAGVVGVPSLGDATFNAQGPLGGACWPTLTLDDYNLNGTPTSNGTITIT